MGLLDCDYIEFRCKAQAKHDEILKKDKEELNILLEKCSLEPDIKDIIKLLFFKLYRIEDRINYLQLK
jgi:hypothetical protein